MSATGARRGLLLVVSSPSGAGKTTLSRRLIGVYPELRFSVSYTTRPRRAGETDGVDYHFIGDDTFERMVAAGAFAEWAHVHGRRYGTATETVRRALDTSGQVLFDVDYQGAERLKERFPGEARLVFILPPSMAVLAQRLRGRATDSPEVIARRLRKAREELSHYRSYEYLLVNDDIERAFAELCAVYLKERAAAGLGPAPGPEVLRRAESCRRERRTERAEALLTEAGED